MVAGPFPFTKPVWRAKKGQNWECVGFTPLVLSETGGVEFIAPGDRSHGLARTSSHVWSLQHLLAFGGQKKGRIGPYRPSAGKT